MKTIAFLGNPAQDRYSYNWCIDGQELGYQTKLNDISGLTKQDIVIIDKQVQLDLSSCPARKILFFPDVIRTEKVQTPYLNNRTQTFLEMSEKSDLIVMPPNREVMSYGRSISQKDVFPFTFGVYRRYFSFFPAKFPHKDTQIGFCWTLGSHRRDSIARELKALPISAYGKEMFKKLSRCTFALNAHYSPLPNNEQRLTEIPLACAVPVSESLSFPELLSDLYWLPIEEYPKTFSRKEYREIIKNNVQAVRHKYNSLQSLKMILSYLDN